MFSRTFISTNNAFNVLLATLTTLAPLGRANISVQVATILSYVICTTVIAIMTYVMMMVMMIAVVHRNRMMVIGNVL